jgi:hypothetical protein
MQFATLKKLDWVYIVAFFSLYRSTMGNRLALVYPLEDGRLCAFVRDQEQPSGTLRRGGGPG